MSLRSPICGSAVVLMRACLPLSIGPGVIAEFRRILELSLCYASAIATESRVIFERRPWNGVVAMRQSEETAEPHDSLGDSTRDLLDQEMVNFSNRLFARAVDLSPLDIFARD